MHCCRSLCSYLRTSWLKEQGQALLLAVMLSIVTVLASSCTHSASQIPTRPVLESLAVIPDGSLCMSSHDAGTLLLYIEQLESRP